MDFLCDYVLAVLEFSRLVGSRVEGEEGSEG